MGFGGHASDALKRIQLNRNLKQKHRNRYNEMKKAVAKIQAKYHTFHDRSELSPEQMLYLKYKMKKQIVKNRQKAAILSFSITALIVTASVFIIKFLYNYFIA